LCYTLKNRKYIFLNEKYYNDKTKIEFYELKYKTRKKVNIKFEKKIIDFCKIDNSKKEDLIEKCLEEIKTYDYKKYCEIYNLE
jgi:hypothetical protein